MKVRLGTIEVTDEQRRAVRAFYGKRGLATRQEVRELFIALAQADLEIIVSDLDEEESRKSQDSS